MLNDKSNFISKIIAVGSGKGGVGKISYFIFISY